MVYAMESVAALPIKPPSWPEESLIAAKLYETRSTIDAAAQFLRSLIE
jgi:hypothetical protein